MSPITIQPLTPPEGSQINFGAVVSNVDIENLSGKNQIIWFSCTKEKVTRKLYKPLGEDP